MLTILKQLRDDLANGKMDTLKESNVLWTHIKTEILEPSSAFDHLLLKKCVQLLLKESICNVQQSIGKMQITLE